MGFADGAWFYAYSDGEQPIFEVASPSDVFGCGTDLLVFTFNATGQLKSQLS